jgi:predicted DNA-binding transcriptional regulator AlpA
MKVMSQVKLLTPGQMAEKLNVSHQSLWRWRQQNTGPAHIVLGKSCVRYLPLTIGGSDFAEVVGNGTSESDANVSDAGA